MKYYRLDYFDKFSCIADKCDFTCCQDWLIAVDDETLDNWKQMDIPDTVKFRDSKCKCLADYVDISENSSIKLIDHVCPFLNEKSLCNIVLEYGEENISDTCHTFPRERREYADRIEASLSLGCKAAVKLLFENNEFNILENDTDDDIEAEHCPEYLYEIRKWFIEIALNNEIPVNTVLKILFYLILDIDDKNIDSVEKLNEYKNSGIVDELFKMIQNTGIQADFDDQFNEDNELLLDLFVRYYEQEKYLEYISDIFEYAEDIEGLSNKDMTENEDNILSNIDDNLFDLYEEYEEKIYVQYEDKIRLVITEELFASLLTGESSVAAMTIKLEWLAIELAVLKQWMFIRYSIDKEFNENTLVQIIAVLFRITGYCDDDIIEYMNNSFEEIIWDWGYMNLII